MDIEFRLAKLEKSNRYLKFSLVSCFLVGTFVLILGQAATPKFNFKEVEATRFVLKNPEGGVVGEWSGNRHGSEMRFYGDTTERTMITICVDADKKHPYCFFSLRNNEGKRGIDLSQSMRGNIYKDESTHISMYDKKGRQRMMLLVDDDGPSVNILDTKMRPRASIGTNSLKNPRTDTIEILPENSIVLFNSEGKVVFQAP